MINKLLAAVAVAATLPVAAHVQSQPLQYPGFYVGRGEQGLLVQTGPNVREPQNRRVEIVID